MKGMQSRRIVLGLVCVFICNFVVGCGGASVRTIQAPMDISGYNKVYVADPDVSSKEKYTGTDAKYTEFAKRIIINALKKKGEFDLLESLSVSPGSLKVETKIDIVYGNRALRYGVGFGAGSGSVVCNLKLVDISSGDVKLEMEGYSRLSMGLFGGSMEPVIESNIKKTAKEFVKKL